MFLKKYVSIHDTVSATSQTQCISATQLSYCQNVCMYECAVACLFASIYPDEPSIKDSTTSWGLLEGPPGDSESVDGLKKRLVDTRGHSPPCSKVDTMKLPSAHTSY